MTRTIRIAAAGDIHAGEPLRERIERAFSGVEEHADLVLLAGDLTTHGLPEQAAVLADACRSLADKLDRFFTTPETAGFPGSYGGTIHEMLEARDVRMGQWGFSNQVSHHIPWMYAYAKQPWKTAEKVREVMRRLYSGSEIARATRAVER